MDGLVMVVEMEMWRQGNDNDDGRDEGVLVRTVTVTREDHTLPS